MAKFAVFYDDGDKQEVEADDAYVSDDGGSAMFVKHFEASQETNFRDRETVAIYRHFRFIIRT